MSKYKRSKKFDPEGSGYDYETAKKEGLGPDKTGHWPSRAPKSGQILKGRKHPTYHKTVKGEKKAGYQISKGGHGKYYSHKEKYQKPSLSDRLILRTLKRTKRSKKN
jgi:hypothetical protein